MRTIFFILLGLMLGREASAQRHYVCYYTPERPKIDGVGKEVAWQKAAWTEDFTDIEGDIRPHPAKRPGGSLAESQTLADSGRGGTFRPDPPAPKFRTRAKLLWDSVNLYIYAELQEPDLWAEMLQHDMPLYRENNFEFFIDPDNDTHNYFELEINARGTVMDLFMTKSYRNGGKALLSWEALGLRSAVSVSGTLNRPGDMDRGWSVEMAIPLTSFRLLGDKPLGDSSLVRINFSRVEWDRDVVGGRYMPRVDSSTGRRLPEHNWVWSPQGIVNMHVPEKWGYLLFSSLPVGGDTVALVLPAEEKARQYLWEVYYRQRKYRADHGVYAKDLEALGLLPTVQDEKGETFRLEMEATTMQYTVVLTGNLFQGALRIDQDGKVVSGIGKY